MADSRSTNLTAVLATSTPGVHSVRGQGPADNLELECFMVKINSLVPRVASGTLVP